MADVEFLLYEQNYKVIEQEMKINDSYLSIFNQESLICANYLKKMRKLCQKLIRFTVNRVFA